MRSAQTVAGNWLGPMSLPTAIAVAVMVLVLGWPVSAQVRAGASRQAPALHIVVIEGEDAVNIIQQKTAVVPVVEVRDRNDQPVAGAVVNFAIRSGRATFAGARTLSVTTNAAGRAVAAGFAPTGSGALQVSATAALQGQTAAAVTITQTTVQTAAQAAAVSGAGSTGGAGGAAGGGAGAGGGGLSATTLGIVGGAAVGGALVATQVLDLGGSDGGGTKYRGPFSGVLTTVAGACSFDQQETGTVELNLTVSDSGLVSGDAQVDASQTIVRLSPQCGGLTLGATEKGGCCNPSPRVTGSAQSLSFSGSHPGNIGSNWTYAFIGFLSGQQVTGVFTLTVQSPNFRGTADFPVTLTKQ